MAADFGASIWGPALATAIFGKLFGGGGDQSASAPTSAQQLALTDDMRGLLAQQRGYMTQMDPLRESVLLMAKGMMPIRYQVGSDFRVPPTGGGPIGGPPPLPGGGGGGSGTEIQDQGFEDRAQSRYDRFSGKTPEEILAAYQDVIGRRSWPDQPRRPRRE